MRGFSVDRVTCVTARRFDSVRAPENTNNRFATRGPFHLRLPYGIETFYATIVAIERVRYFRGTELPFKTLSGYSET